jgi:hypothetical protein
MIYDGHPRSVSRARMLTDKGWEMLDAIKKRMLDVEAPAGLLLWKIARAPNVAGGEPS